MKQFIHIENKNFKRKENKGLLFAIKCLCFILSFVFIMYPGVSNRDLADYHLYLLSILIIIEIIQVKAISLYSVWIAGFIYIILSEMILFSNGKEFDMTVRYILSANNMVLLGYCVSGEKKRLILPQTSISPNSRIYLTLLILFTLFYLYDTFPTVLMSYTYGRQLVSTVGTGTFIGTLDNALGISLPSLIAYFVVHVKKKSKWLALLFVLPIFVFIFLLSTRFKLLFSVLPFFLISGFLDLNKINLKSTTLLILCVLVLNLVTQFVKFSRNGSFFNNEIDDFVEYKYSSSNFIDAFAQQCSPEGCVSMTRLAERYFEDHDYTYGKSIGFIAYFWIPRGLWPEKPTQVDHWLPRYFNPQMADTASTASGFTGELRADFGYFSLFFLFVFGFFLQKCNLYLKYYNYGRSPYYQSLYASLLIPTTFFCVRGLNLSITTFIVSVIFIKLLSYTK